MVRSPGKPTRFWIHSSWLLIQLGSLWFLNAAPLLEYFPNMHKTQGSILSNINAVWKYILMNPDLRYGGKRVRSAGSSRVTRRVSGQTWIHETLCQRNKIKQNKSQLNKRSACISHFLICVYDCKKSRGNWTDIVPLKENKQVFLHGKVALVLADLNTLRFVLLYWERKSTLDILIWYRTNSLLLCIFNNWTV